MDRDVASFRLPQLDRHGERRTYTRGCRCDACTWANTMYERDYREAQRQGRPRLGAHVDRTPVAEVIAQLLEEGYTKSAMALAVGSRRQFLQSHPVVTLRTVTKFRRLLRHWTT